MSEKMVGRSASHSRLEAEKHDSTIKDKCSRRKLEKENLRFRAFLKNHAAGEELDRQFLRLHNELFAEYNCCKCGNCCKAYSTTLSEHEVGSIATFLGLSRQEVFEKYLSETTEGCEIKAPCGFLNANGACAIQECKPDECRQFPYTNKPGRLESLLGIVSFAEECPVVFEIIERFKDTYHFRR